MHGAEDQSPILEARNERIETGAPVKARSKGKPVSVEREARRMLSMESARATPAVSATIKINMKKKTQSSSPAPTPQTQINGKNSLKGKALREVDRQPNKKKNEEDRW